MVGAAAGKLPFTAWPVMMGSMHLDAESPSAAGPREIAGNMCSCCCGNTYRSREHAGLAAEDHGINDDDQAG
jgi:hypothetical protein